MIKICLKKLIALSICTVSIIALNTIDASAEWKQNNNGWWYTEGNSWATGWKLIDGKWYFFNNDGYMSHDITIDGYKIGSDGTLVQNDNSTSIINKISDSLDGNVSINYKIMIADKINIINSEIIKATRKALFDSAFYFAKQADFNGYPINNDILIFDVKEKGTDNWEVDFYEKKSDSKEFNTNVYSSVIVEKQKDGSYIGGTTIH